MGLSGGRTLLEENTPLLPRVVAGDPEVCGLAQLWCQDPELLVQALGVQASSIIQCKARCLGCQAEKTALELTEIPFDFLQDWNN